jgi:hypothetical protein
VLFAALHMRLVALRDDSRRRSNLVAFEAKRTFSERLVQADSAENDPLAALDRGETRIAVSRDFILPNPVSCRPG